jgi:hypothetical protein
MTFEEICYRVKSAVVTQVESKGFWTANVVPPADLSHCGKKWIGGVTGCDSTAYVFAAEAILEGKLKIFGFDELNFGVVPEWNMDPLSGKKVSLTFGKKLNYRNFDLTGDIRRVWEPNRHLHLVTLAQAFHLSGDQRYLASLEMHLTSWFDQCPYLLGPNWVSALELGIRLINWSFVWHLIYGTDCPLFEGARGRILLDRWLNNIYQHAHFISRNLSKHSSANNHLIGESAGLFLATITWPFWEDFVRWKREAQGILIQEALLQNTADGINKEQAISYQQFVLDFLVISALAAKANGIEFPKVYWDRIETMLEYLASVMDVGGIVPMIGDGDDGVVVRLSQEEGFCPFKSLLATGAVLFQRPEFKTKAGQMDDKTRWLLGEKAEAHFSLIQMTPSMLPIQRAFPEGGYYVLGCAFETVNEIRLVVDAGPIGYQSIAAHGHSDALSFTLSIGGKEFLIDPGTYVYNQEDMWRNYFRGTSAHNTVCVDGKDQSVPGGNFMWLQKAVATCEAWESTNDIDLFVGVHNGYTRLVDPVLHRREIRLVKSERRFIVVDTIECQGSHQIECLWHFSEYCQISVENNIVIASNNGISMKLFPSNHDFNILTKCGEINPPMGWVSRHYGIKVPSTTVVFQYDLQRGTRLVTEIVCGSKKYNN